MRETLMNEAIDEHPSMDLLFSAALCVLRVCALDVAFDLDQ
jgi:hypothetical protein